MGLRASKKERTRAEILSIAEARFRRDGFAATSIRSIAADIPVSVQTLYNYFTSKEGILAAIAAERFRSMAAGAEQVRVEFLEADDTEGTPVDRFLKLIRWGLRGISNDREFMSLVFLNARHVLFGSPFSTRHEDDAPSLELEASQDDNNRVLLRMFEGMQKAGAIRGDVSPLEVSELYVLIFSDRVARWLKTPGSTVEELEASVLTGLEIVFRGVAREAKDSHRLTLRPENEAQKKKGPPT